MNAKHPNDMTVDEARYELDRFDELFGDGDTGQGVSGKDAVQYRLVKMKVDLFDEVGYTLPPGEDIQEFFSGMKELFATSS